MKKNKNVVGNAVAIGAGIVALGAGAYYYFGPKGQKHQKEAKAWIVGIKTDLDKKIKKIENLTQSVYQNAVDTIAEAYSKKYKEHKDEINSFAKGLKGEWKSVKKVAHPVVKK